MLLLSCKAPELQYGIGDLKVFDFIKRVVFIMEYDHQWWFTCNNLSLERRELCNSRRWSWMKSDFKMKEYSWNERERMLQISSGKSSKDGKPLLNK